MFGEQLTGVTKGESNDDPPSFHQVHDHVRCRRRNGERRADDPEGTGQAWKTPIGNLPTADALDLSGLNLSADDLSQLLAVDVAGWKKDAEDLAANYARLGSHMPKGAKKSLVIAEQSRLP